MASCSLLSNPERDQHKEGPAAHPAITNSLLLLLSTAWAGFHPGTENRGEDQDPLWQEAPEQVEETSIHVVELEAFIQVLLLVSCLGADRRS